MVFSSHETPAACFTPAIQMAWSSARDTEAGSEILGIEEDYELYFQFFEDRGKRLGQLWEKPVHVNVIPCTSQQLPLPHCISKPEIDDERIIFNIAWFDNQDTRPEADRVITATTDYWRQNARPLIVPLLPDTSPFFVCPLDNPPSIELMNGSFLAERSRTIPPVVLLHELTHLLLRMEYILDQKLPLRFVRENNRQFEEEYQKWIVENILKKIHPDFATCLASEGGSWFPSQPSEESRRIADRYQDCWGCRDEICVIVGVKLLLQGKEYVLSETMLLRKIAQKRELSSNFICWSHCCCELSEEGEEITSKPSSKDIRNMLYKDLLTRHMQAWHNLFSYLGLLPKSDRQ